MRRVGLVVALIVGALLVVMSVMAIFSTEEVYFQGDGSTIGAVLYVDGAKKGVLTTEAGALPQLPSFTQAVHGVAKTPEVAPDSGWTWLKPSPGHAVCKARLSPGIHHIMLVSASGDTLRSELERVGEGADVRASFHLMAVQVFTGS